MVCAEQRGMMLVARQRKSLRRSWLAHDRRLVTEHQREGYHPIHGPLPALRSPALDQLGLTTPTPQGVRR